MIFENFCPLRFTQQASSFTLQIAGFPRDSLVSGALKSPVI